MNFAIILAGGVGSRLGARVPKQFVEVMGKPIVAYTLEIFDRHPEVDAIEIVCHSSYVERMGAIVKDYQVKKVIKIVEGGKDVCYSTLNGVVGLDGIAKEDDVLITHWAAAPFVTNDLISDAIRVCKDKGNSISACPFYLLVGENNGDHSSKWVDREKIMLMNAPQCFKYALAKEFFCKAKAEGVLDAVSPQTATVMYAVGVPLYFSKGHPMNTKITTKEDVELFEAVLLKQLYAKGKIDIRQ